MKTSSKKRNSIIAIIISLCLIVGAIFGIIFIPKINEVNADDYNYGKYNEEGGYYNLGGVTFYGVKVKNVTANNSDYWPNYEIVEENGKPVTIKFGEAVLLKEGEAILICFGRQTDDGSGLVKSEDKIISDTVDYLKATVKVNGQSVGNELENNVGQVGETYIKEFGYIIDPNGIVLAQQKMGVVSGKEGKVEFVTDEYEHNGTLQQFSFMFYAFKEGTYNRTEELNEEVRPNVTINGTSYVTDAATQEEFFSEHFYFYNTQNLPYLEFDPERFEVEITKTIHRTSTNYGFYLDNAATSGQITEVNKKITTVAQNLAENKFVQKIEQDLSTLDLYARPLRVENLENGNVRVYFEDLGDYTISYTAVYYDANGKTVLNNLNQDNRADKLSVIGTELTYSDFEKGQTPFRNEENTISADLTGILSYGDYASGNNHFDTIARTLTLSSDVTIAATNQPAVELLFNTLVKGFEVWYSPDNTTYEKQEYSYTSDFETPGYYVVKATWEYEGYKSWLSASNGVKAETLTASQYYVFQIKEQSANMELFVLGDNGSLTTEKVYTNTYVKNGVQIIELEETSEFDSKIYFELTKQGYSQSASQAQTIVLPSEKASELSQAQKDMLASFGITKEDGYYILKPTDNVFVDGKYSLSLRFGKAGKETIEFMLDTEEISGISSYTAESIYGTSYYKTGYISSQGTIGLTNTSFTLNWANKASGAKISASYVRFALNAKEFSQTATDYIVNSAWLATDWAIVLSENNAKTTFEKAEDMSHVTADSVLNQTGLYVFKLEDEAGHEAYYSVIVDNSTPTVLQKQTTSAEDYKKIAGLNNVTEATTILFGTHKAISITNANGALLTTEIEEWLTNNKEKTAVQYLTGLFNNLESLDNEHVINTNQNGNYFITIPIVSVYEQIEGETTKLSNEVVLQGYYNRYAPLDENNRLKDAEYTYQIFDASNSSVSKPSRNYKLKFNTDATQVVIYTEKDNLGSELALFGTKTNEDYTNRDRFFVPTTENVVYLTWATLLPTDELGVYVDVANDGLVCYWYPLVYDKNLKTYGYSNEATEVSLNLSSLTNEQLEQGFNGEGNINVQIPINVLNDGKTAQGKYVITRKYTAVEGETLNNLGNDFETVVSTFYVDRNEIISATDANGENVGSYSYITTFDGGDNKEFFNELFKQSQNSGNYVLQTNQLPIGFYVPVSKYGTAYKVSNNRLDTTTALGLSEIQNLNGGYKFVNNVLIEGLDGNLTYSPFELNVVLVSPATTVLSGKTVNLIYYYSYVAETGYFMLSGYSLGELAPDQAPTPILNPTSFVTNNPLTNSSNYVAGNYELRIGCLKNSNNTFDQNFKVVVNVADEKPSYNLTASYPELENMDNREILGDLTYYYTNANEIIVSWNVSTNSYLTKIDETKISYTYYTNSTWENVAVNAVEINGNRRSFKIQLPQGATRVEIAMVFEVYGNDGNGVYTKYYPTPKGYQLSRTIIIDKTAPSNSITNLQNGDEAVKGLALDGLRETTDSRFSKSKTTGMFNYYTYVVDENYLTNLAKALLNNSSTETKTFYYRQFNNKYTTSIYKETGLGLDPTTKADNMFSEYYAANNGWTKVSEDSIISASEYYEVIEIDLAGNMTIYSVYIGNSRTLSLSYTKFNGVGTENLTISLNEDGEISSYDYLTLNSISFDNYQYLKLNINGVTYYATPNNFETVDNAVVCTSLYSQSGEKVMLKDILLEGQNKAHIIEILDTVTKTTSVISANVASADARLTDNGGAVVVSDAAGIVDSNGNAVSKNLALLITTTKNSALKIDESSIRIFQIKADETFVQYKIGGENLVYAQSEEDSTTIRTYYYIPRNAEFEISTFYILYKDNFGNEYRELIEYKTALYNRFEGEYDVTNQIQNKTEILVSGDINVNISNIYTVSVTTTNSSGNVITGHREIPSSALGASYTKYQLFAETEVKNGYTGGRRTFKMELSFQIPEGIATELSGLYSETANGVIETITVVIYNQLPNIAITDSNGTNITEELFAKEINQSDEITISFNSGNSLAEEMGYTTKVFLRLRESGNYFEISSPYTLSEAGVYDIYLQNFDENGNALDYVVKNDFVISSLDVMFYTVVKTNEDGVQEIVLPTGNIFEYQSGNFASYHYIVNTSEFEIKTNGVNVEAKQIANVNNTYVYEITSVSGTIYKATIAVTVVNKTNNILSANPLIWYLGTTYSVPSDQNYIRSTTKEIYLAQDDIYDEITLRWASYYLIPQNTITCYISNDNGQTWTNANVVTAGEVSTLTLTKSSSLLLKFEDIAGNVQMFSSSSGYPSSTTNVNFIRSVIFNVNGENPVDNQIYNNQIEISLPINTTHFYSTTPVIKILRNNEEYLVVANEEGKYVLTESGTYKISFSAKIEGGTRDLNEDVLTISIINPNDSRWAFNYVNYNGYKVTSITLNGVELSQNLKDRALMVQNEINISAFDKDDLGNAYFNNGIYTITMEYQEEAMGTKTFEFSFWLNTNEVPIKVSLKEGSSTTGKVTVEYNKANLYEVLGDCYIKIGNTIVEINEETLSSESTPITITAKGTHYVQVYTNSGKLAYSYQVKIKAPLDTVSIVLIVVSCVVVVAGLLIFFLLRKKMKVR